LDRENREKSWVPSIVVLSLGWLLLYATRTALSSALKDIGDYWGLSQGFLGFLTSSFFLAYTILQIPSGFLADKFGSRRVLLSGFGIQAAGLLLGAVSSSPYQFLLARVLTGAGQASYFACQQAIVSFTVPAERRSLAMAITTGGAGVGSAVGFVLGNFLSSAGYGWKTPFVALGIASAAFIFLVLAAVPNPRVRTSGSDAAEPSVSTKDDQPSSAAPWVFLALMSAAHFLSMYGFYVMLTWMPYYLETARGLEGGLARVIPIVMPLIMAPATIIGGTVADRKQDKTFVLRCAMPVASVAIALIPGMKSPAALAFALGLYGATGKLVIDPGLVASVAEHSPARTRNTVLALFNFWGACAMSVAPAVTGSIAQVTGSFDVSFYAAGLLNLFGLAAFLAGVKAVKKPISSSRSLTHS
jgi:MFS family permease